MTEEEEEAKLPAPAEVATAAQDEALQHEVIDVTTADGNDGDDSEQQQEEDVVLLENGSGSGGGGGGGGLNVAEQQQEAADDSLKARVGRRGNTKRRIFEPVDFVGQKQARLMDLQYFGGGGGGGGGGGDGGGFMGEVQAKAFAAYSTMIKDDAADGVDAGGGGGGSAKLAHDDFCFSCQDGGDLIECSACTRVYHWEADCLPGLVAPEDEGVSHYLLLISLLMRSRSSLFSPVFLSLSHRPSERLNVNNSSLVVRLQSIDGTMKQWNERTYRTPRAGRGGARATPATAAADPRAPREACSSTASTAPPQSASTAAPSPPSHNAPTPHCRSTDQSKRRRRR